MIFKRLQLNDNPFTATNENNTGAGLFS